MTTYTIPACSECWTEQEARDFAAGVAVPTDTCDDPDPSEKSFRQLALAYTKAYTENPLLSASRYLDTLNGRVLWQ